MKRIVAWAAAAIFVAAPLLFWTVLNVRNDSFSAETAQQLLLYGRLCGLLAAIVFFFQLATMGPKRLLDAAVGKASLVKAHRKLGGFVAALVAAHIGLILKGRQMAFGDMDFAGFLKDPWGIAACVGILALVAVWVTAGMFVGKRLAFPKFRIWHKLAFVGILGVFVHQLTMGRDFTASPAFRIVWCVLLVLVCADLVRAKLAAK